MEAMSAKKLALVAIETTLAGVPLLMAVVFFNNGVWPLACVALFFGAVLCGLVNAIYQPRVVLWAALCSGVLCVLGVGAVVLGYASVLGAAGVQALFACLAVCMGLGVALFSVRHGLTPSADALSRFIGRA